MLNRDLYNISNLTNILKEIICEHILKANLGINTLDEVGNIKIVEKNIIQYVKRKSNRGSMGHEK